MDPMRYHLHRQMAACDLRLLKTRKLDLFKLQLDSPGDRDVVWDMADSW